MTSNIIQTLQTAIGPMILISAIGLLLLTMTNRLGRTIDRARHLATIEPGDGIALDGQLPVLFHRARILRRAILWATASALCGALLIIGIFISALLGVFPPWLIVPLFSGAMVSLIVSLIFFMSDINLSLRALKVEIETRRN